MTTPPAAQGTPITAPATRHAFSTSEPAASAAPTAAAEGEATAPEATEDAARRHAIEQQRRWSMAAVIAAISGGPRASQIIEAAARPGPVEPGSLIEAVKALRPAPTLPTRTV